MNKHLLRPISEFERQVLERLLSAPFRGRDEVSSQIQNSQVEVIDKEGSLKFSYEGSKKAIVDKRIPTEGEAPDTDGVPIYFLLHVVDGIINELEIYKADGTKIIAMPNPSAILLLPQSP